MDTDALVSTCTGAEHCTAMSKDLGAACGRTGTCGGRIITINHGAGPGEDIAVLVITFTGCAPYDVGMVRVGETSEATGN